MEYKNRDMSNKCKCTLTFLRKNGFLHLFIHENIDTSNSYVFTSYFALYQSHDVSDKMLWLYNEGKNRVCCAWDDRKTYDLAWIFVGKQFDNNVFILPCKHDSICHYIWMRFHPLMAFFGMCRFSIQWNIDFLIFDKWISKCHSTTKLIPEPFSSIAFFARAFGDITEKRPTKCH